MGAKIVIEFSPLCPVKMFSSMEIEQVFGKLYKYDFPKWCAENNIRCFYAPETLVYVVIPKSLREL
jgi:hypothetical protein